MLIFEIFYAPGKVFESLPGRRSAWVLPLLVDVLVLVAITAATVHWMGLETILRQRLPETPLCSAKAMLANVGEARFAIPFLHGLVHHPDLLSFDVTSMRVFACGGADVPPAAGPIGGDLGYLKYATFIGDNRSFSVTFAEDGCQLAGVWSSNFAIPACDELGTLRGDIDGTSVDVTLSPNGNGCSFDVNGVLNGANQISGNYVPRGDCQVNGSGTFSITRDASATATPGPTSTPSPSPTATP